jgi:uncharacterized protein
LFTCLLPDGYRRKDLVVMNLISPDILSQQEIYENLERRLGRSRTQERMEIEREHEKISDRGINFLDPQNWYSLHSILRVALKISGLYWRGHRNSAHIQIRRNHIQFPNLPSSFVGFTILHLSDLHLDFSWRAIERLISVLPDLHYDICVLTGDYRGEMSGLFEEAIRRMAIIRPQLKGFVYGVLGNHDTIRMVPALENMGIQMLLNESAVIKRGNDRIHLVGVDDVRYHRAEDFEKVVSEISQCDFAILLSHTPEIYRKAAEANFDFLLAGHTHGGQICLPGSIPLLTQSVLPRRMAAGSWKYKQMSGYTSVGVGTCLVETRFNCPPEITLHHLERA